MPAKSLEIGPSGTADIPLVAADLWALYLENANERAAARAELWNRSLGAFLLFAGLFAGVVSSFVISSAAGFQSDPQVNILANISATLSHSVASPPGSGFPSTTVAINFLWFSSLTFTLISALAAVLAQTWLANFSFIPIKGFNGAMERWIHDDNAHKWRLHKAIAWITVLIQLSLFLFLAGFALQAVVDDRGLGWLIVALVGLTFVMYIIITVLPWISPKTPFRTPFSDLTVRTQRPEDYFEDPESSSPSGGDPSAVRHRTSLLGTYRNLMKTPSRTHIELGIYSALLMDTSSTNTVLDAAVAELMGVTKPQLSSEHCDSLIEFGLPATLCLRLKQLCQPRAEQNPALVQRMKIYLLAIMWMVNEESNHASQLALAFSPLLRKEDGPLLRLHTLPPECQAIAFGVRTHLLASRCMCGDISPTDWFTMVKHLEPESASTVFRAVVRGLEMNAEISHDCARVLAIYMHSDRFAVETVESKKDPGRFVRRFFGELENAWKFTLCTNTVQLLAEDRFDRQITGLEGLSNLAQDDTFRETMDAVLPNLLETLSRVNWRTSVSCLQKLSKMYEQDIFRESMRGILPKFVLLLAEPSKAVRDAVVHLLNLMDLGELTRAVNCYHKIIVRDLKSSDMSTRIGSIRILTELARTEKMPDMITKFIPDVLACVDTADEELHLNVIQMFQELAKQSAQSKILCAPPILLTPLSQKSSTQPLMRACPIWSSSLVMRTGMSRMKLWSSCLPWPLKFPFGRQ
ncbi:hypothetical protein FB45DRAFT_213925 [Roridomyces roridus]|uniref:DUF6535 domain-containing protein n=1 Tax=Roridomyces roridus TaxID=1738132 RepID=A0AAD7FGP5_9AGAR|nr:hypothetical protein FB45DRAFT_213925 [Roridomyces roridus]